MSASQFDSSSHVSSSIRTFPQLQECRQRLEDNGTGKMSPAGWHRQALAAAADMLSNADTALQANQDAVMVLLMAALPEYGALPPPLDLSVAHAQGGVARVWIAFSPEGEGATLPAPVLVTPLAAHRSGHRVWVSLDSVPTEDLCDVVAAIAAHQNGTPGDLLSILGAGALLTFIQTMEAMAQASNEIRASGYGSAARQVDALLSAQLGEKLLLTPQVKPPSV